MVLFEYLKINIKDGKVTFYHLSHVSHIASGILIGGDANAMQNMDSVDVFLVSYCHTFVISFN